MRFKNPEYQKKHEEMCESYKKFTGGRDFEKDFDDYQKSGSPEYPVNKEFEDHFEAWRKSQKDMDRKKKPKKSKAKRKVCRCKK